jgi:hypothetical protein
MDIKKRKPKGFWTPENVEKEARKHSTIKSFRTTYYAAYRAAQRIFQKDPGFLDKIYSHMKINYQNNPDVSRRVSRSKHEQTLASRELVKAGVPMGSPVHKYYLHIRSRLWSLDSRRPRKKRVKFSVQDFLNSNIRIKNNGKEAEFLCPHDGKWHNLLSGGQRMKLGSPVAHHCYINNVFLYFTTSSPNLGMGKLGDTVPDFIRTAWANLDAGAAVSKNELKQTKELIGKLYEAINKMDSRLCDIVPKRFSFKN